MFYFIDNWESLITNGKYEIELDILDDTI